MHTSEIVLQTLKEGNAAYVKSGAFAGDISPEKRLALTGGQSPRAVVITCADSRVIPEVIFSCGLGELFTIRIAGNVIDAHQLGSIEYAVSHLKTPLVVILGHTGCGAVQAALQGEADGHIRYIVDTIREAIGEEKDPRAACHRNVLCAGKEIRAAFSAEEDPLLREEQVACAVYDIETGKIEWLDEDE